MSSEKMSVDTVRLRQISGDMISHYNALKRAEKEMNDRLDEAEAMWEGPAKQTFSGKRKSIEESNSFNHTAFEKASEAMEEAAKKYDSADSEVRSYISKVKV